MQTGQTDAEFESLRGLDQEVGRVVMGQQNKAPGGSYPHGMENAWMVVERMKALGFWLCLWEHDNGDWDGTPPCAPYWHARFSLVGVVSNADEGITWGHTAPEAICKAALKALRVQESHRPKFRLVEVGACDDS